MNKKIFTMFIMAVMVGSIIAVAVAKSAKAEDDEQEYLLI